MPLTPYKRGDIWHFRGTVNKRRLRGSTGTGDKATAERFIAEITAKQWKSSFDGPGAILTFSDAAIRYLNSGKPSRFIGKLIDLWKDTLVEKISRGAIRQSCRTLYPNAGPATWNRQVIVPTVAIINFSADAEQCSPIPKVKRFAVPKKEKVPATWPWVQAFVSAASPHLGALATFLYLTGARISEALSVMWEDVDFQNRRVLIRQGKVGGSERYAHLPRPLLIILANLERRGPTVFRYVSPSSCRQVWDNTVRRAKIKHLSFHALRHGYATGLLHKGVDVMTVAKRGGWKSPAHVFSTYGHATEDETVADLLIDTPATQDDFDVPNTGRKSTA